MKRLCLILILASAMNLSCSQEVYRVKRPIMGTLVNLSLITDSKSAPGAADAVFREIERIDRMMSSYKKESDISVINRSGTKMVTVNKETFLMIKKAVEISDRTSGAFDITFNSIAHLWDYRKTNFTPPSKDLVKKSLPLVNYKNIILDEKLPGVAFKKPGMKIGLGGIAKGYTIRRGVEVLKKSGVRAGIVDAGGDLQVFGTKFGKKWTTGLMNPRKRNLLLSIELDDMDAIATSGDYERMVEYKNRKYHHIIHPRTGEPTETFASVSVISKDPVLSDAYSTSIFVMGLEKTKEFLKREKGIGVILIDMDMRVYISKRLKDKIKLFHEIKVEWL
jgi:FAD:protein FMN transferase